MCTSAQRARRERRSARCALVHKGEEALLVPRPALVVALDVARRVAARRAENVASVPGRRGRRVEVLDRLLLLGRVVGAVERAEPQPLAETSKHRFSMRSRAPRPRRAATRSRLTRASVRLRHLVAGDVVLRARVVVALRVREPGRVEPRRRARLFLTGLTRRSGPGRIRGREARRRHRERDSTRKCREHALHVHLLPLLGCKRGPTENDGDRFATYRCAEGDRLLELGRREVARPLAVYAKWRLRLTAGVRSSRRGRRSAETGPGSNCGRAR